MSRVYQQPSTKQRIFLVGELKMYTQGAGAWSRAWDDALVVIKLIHDTKKYHPTIQTWQLTVFRHGECTESHENKDLRQLWVDFILH